MSEISDAGHSPLISVIIVNYQGVEVVEAAIESLRGQSFRDFELIIVDNASNDGSPDLVNFRGLPQGKLIRETCNHGFAGGVNIAVEHARGRYLALFNPDCVAKENWLEKLADAARRFPDTAMFASTQICLNDPDLLDGAGDNYFFLGVPWRGGHGQPVSRRPEFGECFSPCGAAAMIRKDCFLGQGGFDREYFCYCEDVDLAFRLRLSGERCLYIPDAQVWHKGSAISGKNSKFTVFLGTRNLVWTYFKNMPLAMLVLTYPVHALALVYLYLRQIGSPRAKYFRQGAFSAYRHFGKAWSQRRKIHGGQKGFVLATLAAMTWNPRKLSRRDTVIKAALKER